MSFNKIIAQIENFSINDLALNHLIVIRTEIEKKRETLEDRLNEIHRSFDKLSSGSEDKIKEHLPQSFTSSLRKVFINKRDIEKLKKLDERYDDELKKINNLIQKKILNQKLITVMGSQFIFRIKEYIITILVILVLGAMFYEFTHEGLSTALLLKLFIFDTACCIAFLLNFFFELSLADSKKWYWRTHWIDFITSIPIPNAKILRAGRILRLARLLRVLRFLRFFRALMLLSRGMESLREMFDMRIMKKTLLYSIILLFLGSAGIIYFEQRPESVSNYLEAFWWSFTTLVTGGFGYIHNPTTTGGMLVTTLLVIAGMVLIGVFIAALSTVLSAETDDGTEYLKNYIEFSLNDVQLKLNNRLDRIEEKLK